MKLGIISGSHRKPSQSEKVARKLESLALAKGEFNSSYIYTLADNPLPLFDEGVWNGEAKWDLIKPIKEELTSCDAFIIVSPEWHGQVPAGLKNFFLIFSQKELGHKPAMIASVSSTMNGAYPVSELRMSSYKNCRLCYIPEHLIFRNVESIFNEKDEDNDERSHPYYIERSNWALGILAGYSSALSEMRKSTELTHPKFKSGM